MVAGLATAGAAWAAAPVPASTEDCALLWQVAVRLDTRPRQLQISLRFNPGTRQTTTLRLPAGWGALQDALAPGAPALADGAGTRPVAGAPALRNLAHPPGDPVQWTWQLTPAAADGLIGTVQLADRWLAFSGAGLLPVPDDLDERNPPVACVQVSGLPAASRWASSHGLADGTQVLWRIPPGPAPLAVRVQQALYVGGALQSATRGPTGGQVTAVMPAEAGWRFDADALAQGGAEALAAQRRQWGDVQAMPRWLLLLLPPPAGSGTADAMGGTAWHQSLALQAPADLAVPGPMFDTLVAQALARAWLNDRFGPLAHAGRGDDALRAWYSEGWADYLAHRSLLRDGRWTAADYANELNRKIAQYLSLPELQLPNAQIASAAARNPAVAALPAARGEWLALHWHASLRAAGQPGLEALMRRLLVPMGQARREGPISGPLATHRLVAALRAMLDDQPLRDIQQRIEQGEPWSFGSDALGPCFIGQVVRVPTWHLGLDPSSFSTRVVQGVQAGGPAETAGLRDGMRLLGHTLVPGDALQPVLLQVLGQDGSRQDFRYLAAGEPVRDLPRYRPIPEALKDPACLGWLGLGPQAQQAAGFVRRPASPSATANATASANGAKPKAKSGKATKTGKGGKAVKAVEADAGKVGSKGAAKTSGTPGSKAGNLPNSKAASKVGNGGKAP